MLAPVLNFILAEIGFLDWAGLQEKKISLGVKANEKEKYFFGKTSTLILAL